MKFRPWIKKYKRIASSAWDFGNVCRGKVADVGYGNPDVAEHVNGNYEVGMRFVLFEFEMLRCCGCR